VVIAEMDIITMDIVSMGRIINYYVKNPVIILDQLASVIVGIQPVIPQWMKRQYV
jgi:hypothetical protein